MPTKPAPVDADRKLFDGLPIEIRQLAKKARAELRQAERVRYAKANGLGRDRTPLR